MKQILSRLFNHEHLSEAEARQLLLDITAGRYPDAQVAALLTAFCMRDITVDELTGFREALMQTRVPIDFAPYRPIDIVGTGGDGKNTFNISTCACFVVAGAGYKVAKHGNYGATSVSGASDVIEEHGIRFTADPDTLRRSMDECNLAYLHAQLFNPAMKSVAAVRKSLGVRTLFNLLGPLVNPCRPAYQLLGVSQLSLMRLYTYVFCKAGVEFAVVNSLDNYDEISLTDEFKVMTRRDERIYRPLSAGDRGDPGTAAGLLPDGGGGPGHPEPAAHRGPGRPAGHRHPHPGGDRRRQGAHCLLHPPVLPPGPEELHPGQLRGHPREPGGERALRL